MTDWLPRLSATLVVVALLNSGVLALVRAQGVASSVIRGFVSDANGNPVSRAAVTVRNVQTNATETLVTNEKGVFVAERLRPGTYDVTARVTGFGEARQTGIFVSLGQMVDMMLSVGAEVPLDPRLFQYQITRMPNKVADTTTISKTDTVRNGPTSNPFVNAELKCDTSVVGLVRGVLTGVYDRPGQVQPVRIDLDGAEVRLLPLIGGKPYVNSVFAQDAGPLGQFLYDFRAMTWWTAVTEVALAVNDRRLFKSPYPLFSSAPRGFVEGRCVLRGIPVDTMRVRK